MAVLPQLNERFEMQNFLNLSFGKQKTRLERMDDADFLVQILRFEYIESTQTLDLIVKRLQKLKGTSLSTVIDAPIRKAIERGNVKHIRLLLPFHTYHPKSDLYYCIKNQQFEIFDLLLANTQLDKQEMLDKVLADVCLSDDAQTLNDVDSLIERGANPSAFNLKSLGHAIQMKNMLMIAKLIPLSDVKNFGNSVLASAAQNNLPTVVQQLLEAGAPYNEDNSRPLKVAIRYNQEAVVECLLQWDKAFDSVMETAFCSPHIEMSVLELLWNHCDIDAVRTQLPNYTNEGRERFEILYAQYQNKILRTHVDDGQETRTRKI